MNKTKYILLVAAAMLAACKNEPVPTYTVGADDNAIVLSAGIADGGADVSDAPTRAGAHRAGVDDTNHDATANGGGHLPFTSGTKAALQVSGTWTGHDPVSIVKTTTATIGAIVDGTDGKHDSVELSPKLYWDDYGTADPANAETGRAEGLTIYGAAVNGVTTAPVIDGTTGKQWTALSWKLAANQSAGWSTKDLLISNNVRSGTTSGCYLFSERNTTGKLLEFTHAMAKVTVELTAGAGFADAKFVNKPEVTLLQFYYTGTYNVESKTPNVTDAKTDIKAHLAEVVTASGGTWSDAPATWAASHKAKYDALVFPGNTFSATIADDAPKYTPTSETVILELNADGNIFKVTAAQLVKAIVGTSTTGTPVNGTLEQAKNYILKITVSKTGIDVTATILDWVEISAENETPIINIAEAYGHTGTDLAKSFDLYRSTAVDGSYLTGIDEGNHTVVNYVAATGEPLVPAHYELATQMYWPNHSTHYFFRGIWPLVDSSVGPTSSQVKDNSIEVANVAYKQGYYPSDLMIGIPRKDDGSYDETCKVAGHDKSAGANGICATEGKIRMNFQYAMSQVIVELTTTTGDDKVIFDDQTKVEIIGGYTTGEIKLSDESSDFTGKTVADYFMHNVALSDYDSYHDAIIPQALQDGEGNATLKFRITVKSGDTYDKYETVLGIKDIQVTEGGVKKSITSWLPGKKYTYTLCIAKTGVKVEATIKDWITVTADEDIWF